MLRNGLFHLTRKWPFSPDSEWPFSPDPNTNYGYYVSGGALEVGKASTNAVVSSSILILLADVILTKLLLQ